MRDYEDGTLEYDEKWRTLPYLGIGSLGPGASHYRTAAG